MLSIRLYSNPLLSEVQARSITTYQLPTPAIDLILLRKAISFDYRLPIADCRGCARNKQKQGIMVKSWRLNFKQNQPYVV
ncbi:MAG: hypothetical protein HC786_12985 [Richelia sp. CSU_2_1]|nr:hypothetical protein [Richelia sp. CSU_2_1]